ncbi:MAG: hypothetical protein ACRDYD_06080, partial [Acidimicrobiales bacterium]
RKVSWERGRAEIEALLAAGELEQVTPGPTTANRLLADSTAHLRSARHISQEDPAGAYQLGYDAARKATAALLAAQGLRASRGGHLAVQEAARHQFSGPGGYRGFDTLGRLRRRRNDTEYPMPDSPTVTTDDVAECLASASELIGAALQLLVSGKVEPFRT